MADNIRATPQSPTLGAIASALRKAQQFAGQYQVDPRIPLLGGTSIDELLSLPGAASLAEDVSYNGPRALIRGGNVATGGIGTFRPDPRIADVADVALNATPLAMLAGKGLGRGALAVGRAGARAAERAVPSIMERGGAGAAALQALAGNTTSNVVKPKGGNWLAGSVEQAVGRLRDEPVLSGDIVNDVAGRDIFSEYRKVYEQDPTISLHAWTRQNYPEIYEQAQNPAQAAVNRWVGTKLDKYVRNEMGTPEDPVRALAERGILHQEQQPLTTYNLDDIELSREAGGYPAEGMAKTRAGREWEAAADAAINARTAETYRIVMNENQLAENPWLRNAPPEAVIYNPADPYRGLDNMFGHLVDELTNAMDPASDLPRQLRFDPKDVDKITVPQAVQRVAEINAWRAKQAAEAEKAGMMENLKATPRLPDEGLQLSFVDKPGGAWVDIPETVDDKGMKLCNSIGKAGGWCTQAEWAAKSYGSGDNRLTALVDAEGRPHAQAKITTTKVDAESTQLGDVLTEEEAIGDQFYRNIDTILQERGVDPDTISDVMDYVSAGGSRARVPEEILDILPEVEAQAEAMLPKLALPKPDITELKPPGNSFDSERAQEYAKRDPDYKAKVTESVLRFLNSGDWGNVADLHHYDIVDLGDTKSVTQHLDDIFENDRAAYDIFNAAIDGAPENAPRFMTRSQFIQFLAPYKRAEPEGFAGGGLVKGAVKSMGEMVEKYLAKESAAPVEQKMLQGVYRGYAGEDPGEVVYHAGADFQQPRPGLFTTPERAAAEQFQRFTGAPKLHTLEAKPRRTGTEEDVYAVARRLGIYNPGVPASQYLEQGEGAVFPESAAVVEELRNQGLDALRLRDGISKHPSLVALDPGVVRPAPELFATPQRRVAEYYANKRAAQTGERPHLEMLLVDPFAGRQYGHSTMGTGKQEPMTTRARKLPAEQVQGRTKLYAGGGAVSAPTLTAYDPNEIDTIVSRMKEEFNV